MGLPGNPLCKLAFLQYVLGLTISVLVFELYIEDIVFRPEKVSRFDHLSLHEPRPSPPEEKVGFPATCFFVGDGRRQLGKKSFALK